MRLEIKTTRKYEETPEGAGAGSRPGERWKCSLFWGGHITTRSHGFKTETLSLSQVIHTMWIDSWGRSLDSERTSLLYFPSVFFLFPLVSSKKSRRGLMEPPGRSSPAVSCDFGNLFFIYIPPPQSSCATHVCQVASRSSFPCWENRVQGISQSDPELEPGDCAHQTSHWLLLVCVDAPVVVMFLCSFI